MKDPISRRTLVQYVGACVAAAISTRPAQSAESDRLDVKDPAAVALGYVEKAAQVDLKRYPNYIKGSECANCLQLQGKPGGDYRPCGLFPGKLVSVSGWCSGWAAEM